MYKINQKSLWVSLMNSNVDLPENLLSHQVQILP